jgi:hypothetical protein
MIKITNIDTDPQHQIVRKPRLGLKSLIIPILFPSSR